MGGWGEGGSSSLTLVPRADYRVVRSFPALHSDVKISLASRKEPGNSVSRPHHGGKKCMWIAIIFVNDCSCCFFVVVVFISVEQTFWMTY